ETLAPTSTPIPATDTPLPPTDPPQPSDTPPPTDTLAPTDTPVPPTATSVPPTDTPAPTPTSAPTQPPVAHVEITGVYNQSYTEHVDITNRGDAPADLSGWMVSGSKGDEVYHFPGDFTLAAGASVRLHSGDSGTNNPPSEIKWTDKTIWNNKGETVYLRDAQGTLVDEYSY
ncbi:MAG: lamin tail domain-containing protein, partial [Anaerolineae bacterium]